MPSSLICDSCHKNFIPSVSNQTTCLSCMIAPVKHFDTPLTAEELLQEDSMPIMKTCTQCQQPYEATGANQKLCPECKLGQQDKDPETTRISEIQGQPVPTKASVRIIEQLPLSSNVTLEALAADLLRISGCKCLLLDYDEISIKIDKKS